jgi:hypothetical protein
LHAEASGSRPAALQDAATQTSDGSDAESAERERAARMQRVRQAASAQRRAAALEGATSISPRLRAADRRPTRAAAAAEYSATPLIGRGGGGGSGSGGQHAGGDSSRRRPDAAAAAGLALRRSAPAHALPAANGGAAGDAASREALAPDHAPQLPPDQAQEPPPRLAPHRARTQSAPEARALEESLPQSGMQHRPHMPAGGRAHPFAALSWAASQQQRQPSLQDLMQGLEAHSPAAAAAMGTAGEELGSSSSLRSSLQESGSLEASAAAASTDGNELRGSSPDQAPEQRLSLYSRTADAQHDPGPSLQAAFQQAAAADPPVPAALSASTAQPQPSAFALHPPLSAFSPEAQSAGEAAAALPVAESRRRPGAASSAAAATRVPEEPASRQPALQNFPADNSAAACAAEPADDFPANAEEDDEADNDNASSGDDFNESAAVEGARRLLARRAGLAPDLAPPASAGSSRFASPAASPRPPVVNPTLTSSLQRAACMQHCRCSNA